MLIASSKGIIDGEEMSREELRTRTWWGGDRKLKVYWSWEVEVGAGRWEPGVGR